MQRHAGLMAIASIAEGTRQAMEGKLDQIVSYVGFFVRPPIAAYVYFTGLSHPCFGTLIHESDMRRVSVCKCSQMLLWRCSRQLRHRALPVGNYAPTLK
jgi:hypothetical protein